MDNSAEIPAASDESSGAESGDNAASSTPPADVSLSIRTITINDRLDALRAVGLRMEIADALDEDIVRLVVDLSETDFVDSAGLAALANGMKQARRRGGDLRVVAPGNPDAQRVFSLTRFDQVFTMADTAAELVATW